MKEFLAGVLVFTASSAVSAEAVPLHDTSPLSAGIPQTICTYYPANSSVVIMFAVSGTECPKFVNYSK